MLRSHHPHHAESRLGLVTMTVLGALLVGTVGAEQALPAPYSSMALLIAVPTITVLRPCCPVCTMLVGGVTLACAVPLAFQQWPYTPVVAVTVPGGIVWVTAMLALAAHRRTHADTVHAALRAVAETMQRAVLRPVPHRLGPVRAQVSYLAAAPQAQVGGDLYDVVDTPFGVRVILGDVMGKGLAAVEKATDVLGAFRELAHLEPTLAGTARRLDAYLAGHGREEDREEGFVTALLVEIPESGGTAELINCGHPPPLVLSGGRVAFADALPPDPPLGLLGMVEGGHTSNVLTLGPGDRLLLYTDGVTEARAKADGRFYPLAERAAALDRATGNGAAYKTANGRPKGQANGGADAPGARPADGRAAAGTANGWANGSSRGVSRTPPGRPDDLLDLLDLLVADLRTFAAGSHHDDAALLLLRFEGVDVPLPRGHGGEIARTGDESRPGL
ncbi:PP2C family protein-serine/threonine phosphatase [Actinomadura hibisca]|uniref:PP2C family protein-serine/threonine phosphatase n=1 Tax=Actinomadura hibisca TaxID=68565 RepID=UPI00082D5E31|nr:PP2C family protein-serine/threonine phosphatase [Actinomadura hibisca]